MWLSDSVNADLRRAFIGSLLPGDRGRRNFVCKRLQEKAEVAGWLLAGWFEPPEEVSACLRGREDKSRHTKLMEKGCVLVKSSI